MNRGREKKALDMSPFVSCDRKSGQAATDRRYNCSVVVEFAGRNAERSNDRLDTEAANDRRLVRVGLALLGA